MGVTGLWELVKPSADISTNLLQLSLRSFSTTPGLRGCRVGIDASLWIFHQSRMVQDQGGDGVMGPNAALRNLWYKLCQFMNYGLLALFVFDGPNRPKKVNRGGQKGGATQTERDFQHLIGLMGMEWRTARGEAEAELAVLSDRGKIDVILTDDIDTLVFAQKPVTIVRNWSATLTGNQGKGSGVTSTPSASFNPPSSSQPSIQYSQLAPPSQSQPSTSQTPLNQTKELAIFRSNSILQQVGLDHHSILLIALLLGGDYDPQGFVGIGEKAAEGLARAGFGRKLFEGIKSLKENGGNDFRMNQFLASWREEVAEELRTNSTGLIGKKRVSTSTKMRESNFPSLIIINNYLYPNVSRESDWKELNWNRGVDILGLVETVRTLFEWRDGDLINHFRNKFWRGIAVKEMRREYLKMDGVNLLPSATSIPHFDLSDMIKSVTGTKMSKSTDFVQSYRLIFFDAPFTSFLSNYLDTLPTLVRCAIDPKPDKEKEGNDLGHYMPLEFMVGPSSRIIIDEYEQVIQEKEGKKQDKEDKRIEARRKKEEKSTGKTTQKTTLSKKKKKKDDDSSDSDDDITRSSQVAGTSLTKEEVARNKKNAATYMATFPAMIDSDDDDSEVLIVDSSPVKKKKPIASSFIPKFPSSSTSASTKSISPLPFSTSKAFASSASTSKSSKSISKSKTTVTTTTTTTLKSITATTTASTVNRKRMSSISSIDTSSSETESVTVHVKKSPRKESNSYRSKFSSSHTSASTSRGKQVIEISSDEDESREMMMGDGSASKSRKGGRGTQVKGKGKERERVQGIQWTGGEVLVLSDSD